MDILSTVGSGPSGGEGSGLEGRGGEWFGGEGSGLERSEQSRKGRTYLARPHPFSTRDSYILGINTILHHLHYEGDPL